jgi:hypothetical protein
MTLDTPESIALELLRMIALNEGKIIGPAGGKSRANRTWILNTYAECLNVVKPTPVKASRSSGKKAAVAAEPPAGEARV